MKKNAIGIDFGTSTSMIRVKEYNDTKEDFTLECKSVIMSQDGQVTAPTLIRVNGEVRTYGHEASQVGKGELHSNFKMLIRSDDVRERKLGEELLKDFYSYMFRQYKGQKSYLFTNENVDEETLVSYPPQWDSEQKKLVLQAACSAGFKNVRGMDEATASVNCVLNVRYDDFVKSGLLKYGEPLYVLVIDMGAGTTDLAFVKLTVTEETESEIIGTWPSVNSPYIYGGSMMDNKFRIFLKQWLLNSGLSEEYALKIIDQNYYQLKQWKEQTVSVSLNANESVEECATIENVLSMLDSVMNVSSLPMPKLNRNSFEKIFSAELKAFSDVISSAPKSLLAQTDFVILTGGNSAWYWIPEILCCNSSGLVKVISEPWRIVKMDLPNETVARGLLYPFVNLKKEKMDLQVAKIKKNMAKLTIEVDVEALEKAMQDAYEKTKGQISMPGFHKGKAPQKMVEQMYGKEIFFEDAIHALIPEYYSRAVEKCGLEIVSHPIIDIIQAELGKALIFTAEVATKPEVTLGDYKGVEVPKIKINVTDEDVNTEIKKEQEKNFKIINVKNRVAQLNDIVTIDFEGFVDGVPFDGGQAIEYSLTLGSDTFISGFENQLVGAKVGDNVDVKVIYPEDYQTRELAGKEAVFKCVIKKIETKEMQNLNDNFAKDVFGFDTFAEYKEYVKIKLVEKKENEAKRVKKDIAVDRVIENAQMDIPEAMLQTQCRQMLDNFSRRMQDQGLSMEQYFQFTGMTESKLMEDMKPQALKRIQTRLVLEKVAEVENIQPTKEEVNEEISKMAEEHKMEVEKLKKLLSRRELEQIKKDMAVQKAVTIIADAAREV